MKNLINEIIFNAKRSYVILVIGIILLVVGLILGALLTLSEEISVIHNDNIFLYYNTVFCSEKIGVSLLISRCVNSLLILVLVAILSLNKYTYFLNFILLFYRAFVLGVVGKLFITQILVTGAIMFLLLVFIQAMFLCASILLFMIIIYKRNDKCNDCLINLSVKALILSSILAILGCIIEYLFIIMLFRPFNLIF